MQTSEDLVKALEQKKIELEQLKEQKEKSDFEIKCKEDVYEEFYKFSDSQQAVNDCLERLKEVRKENQQVAKKIEQVEIALKLMPMLFGTGHSLSSIPPDMINKIAGYRSK